MNGWNSPFFITLADIDRYTRKSKSKAPAFRCIKDRICRLWSLKPPFPQLWIGLQTSAVNSSGCCGIMSKKTLHKGPQKRIKYHTGIIILIQYICINNRESVKEITWCYEAINVALKIAQDQTKIHGGMWKFMGFCYFTIILGSLHHRIRCSPENKISDWNTYYPLNTWKFFCFSPDNSEN